MAISPPPLPHHIIDLSHGDPGEKVYRTVHGHVLEKLQEQVHEAIGRIPSPLAADCSLSCDKDLGASLRPIDHGVVFFIDGTRGAGKSTFLRAACQHLCHDLEPKTVNAGVASRPQIGFLSLIDPSRIEMREVLLLNVVTLLHKRVMANSRCISESRSQQQELKKFQHCLEKLAGGLSLLKGDHDPLKDVDPEVFLEAGLERIQHGDGLRSAVHELIDAACRVLCADALVLAFDDADTNAHKGIELMECIRKYLNSPRLVILVAGDMELYSLLVREHFINASKIGKSNLDESRNTQRASMLGHLEEQYAVKLFPAHRRFRLVSLQALLGEDKFLVVKHYKWGDDRNASLIEMIDSLVRLGFFVCSASEARLYREYLLGLPVRSIIQMLKRCAPFFDINPDRQVVPALKLSEKYTIDKGADFRSVFAEGARSISMVGLYDHDIKVDAIVAGDMSALISSVFHLVVKEGQYDTGAYLRPRSQDEGVQACYFMLAAEVARMCRGRPDRFLRYLMQAAGSVAIYGSFKDKIKNPSKDFVKYIGLESSEDALHWAWCSAPFLGSKVKFPKISQYSGDGLKNALVARLSLSYQQNDDMTRDLYCSGFILLGLIERLLFVRNGGFPLEIDVRAVLERTWRIPTGTVGYSFVPLVARHENEEDYVEVSLRAEGFLEIFEKLLQDVNQWLVGSDSDVRNLSESVAVSAVFVGKVWTRLYFNIERQKNYSDPVRIMRELFLCLLKALYIEGFPPHEYNNIVSSQNRDAMSNQVTGADFHGVMSWSYATFCKNYEDDKNKKEHLRKFPILNLLLSCPLVTWLFCGEQDSGPKAPKAKTQKTPKK